MALSLDEMTLKYIQLRDIIAEEDKKHKEAMAPKREVLDQLNAALTGKIQSLGVQSVASEHGTVYLTAKKSASIADGELFWKYVVEHEFWDLVDKRANSTAVEAYIDQYKKLPPGVNFNTHVVVGVRRK